MNNIMNIRRTAIIGLLYLFISLTHGTKCPKQESISRHVICYYEGRTSLNSLNICNCTHIVFADVTRIADNYTLDVFEDATTDLSSIKKRKDDLLTIFTLETKHKQSSAILKSESKRKKLTDGIANFLKDTDFNGVELNFQFEAQDGLGKESLLTFVKELRNALDSIPHKRVKRGGYDVFEKLHDDITTASYSTQRSRNIRNRTKIQPSKKVVVKRIKNSRTTREDKNVDFYDDESELAVVDDDFEEIPIRRRKELDDLEKTENLSNDLLILIRLSIQPEIIAKKYDLKTLSKYADILMVPTHNIVDDTEKQVTSHPSRLMGLSDMLNTDSILDLLTGLGAPKSKLVISLPATVMQFQLRDSDKNTPRSPTVGEPKVVDQSQLCSFLSNGDWTVERDEDLTAPYAFSNKTWLAFEDKISVNIKGKYILLRELAGGAIYPIDADIGGESCHNETGNVRGGIITNTLFNNFRSLERKPRALVLESLQEEIHDTSFSSIEAGVHLSEYRIVRVVDHSGAVHVIRKNTKTQFECSRQGYFSHPLGCNKFYRCVKFDQYSDDFTVFEYDCPAGLAFDERWEVCVWPGSLPHGAPCTGSSEIAPVPRSHYQCPNVEGYYADPENCRWFFACLDHARDGITPLTAYEFRCPFGLVFDEGKLACDWPWLVGGCGNRGIAGVVITKQGGTHTNVHTATFINGGNLAASYGQYSASGQEAYLSGFGASFENTLAGATGFGAKSQVAGANYISSSYDDNQNRESFATVPDYEISGGRILNSGGVVLNQNVNLVGVGVSAPTGGALNEISQYSNLESQRLENSFAVKTENQESAGYVYQKPAVKLELPVHKTQPLLVQTLQPPVVQTVTEQAILTKLEPSLYQYPLSTPRPFSVDIPSVQVNQEKASGYSSQTIVSSTPQTLVTEGYVSEVPSIHLQTPKVEIEAVQQVELNQKSEGYLYEKPKIAFELPVVTPKPEIQIQAVTPVQPIVTQNELVHSVSLKQPRIELSTPKPIAIEQPIINYQEISIKPKLTPVSTPVPIVSITPAKQIFYQQKPTSVTIPIVHEQQTFISTPKPFSHQQEIVQPVQISTPKPVIYEQKEYLPPVQISTPQPVVYEQKVHVPAPKPVVYEQREYLPPVQISTPQPVLYEQKVHVPPPKPVVYEQKEYLPPVQVSTPVVQKVHIASPKPVIYEQREYLPPVQISTPQPVVYEQKVHIPKPKPVVYEQREYLPPIQVSTPVVYEQKVQVSTPKPILYEQKEIVQPVQISTPVVYEQKVHVQSPKPVIYSTPQPVVYEQKIQVSTPKPVIYEQKEFIQPVQVSTPQPVVYEQKVHVPSPKPVIYEQREYLPPVQVSTPVVYEQKVQVSTPKPILYEQKQYLPPVQISTPQPVVYEQKVHVPSPKPVVYQAPVQVSTPVVYEQKVHVSPPPKPVVYQQKEYLPPVQISTPKPVVYEQTVQVSTPKPIVFEQRQYLPPAPKVVQYQQLQFVQPIVHEQKYVAPVSTPKQIFYEQKQFVTPISVQKPIQISTPKPIIYEQKIPIQISPAAKPFTRQEFIQIQQKPVVIEQKVQNLEYLPPKPIEVSTPQQPVVYSREYLPPVTVSTPKPVTYIQKQRIQPISVTTINPPVYHQEYVEIKQEKPVQISTPKVVPTFRQEYVQPVVYEQRKVTTAKPIYVQPIQYNTPKQLFFEQKQYVTPKVVVNEQPAPVVFEQKKIAITPKPVIYEQQEVVQPAIEISTPQPVVVEQRYKEYTPVVTQREYLPPVKVTTTTESVIFEQPETYVAPVKVKSRNRYRLKEYSAPQITIQEEKPKSNTVYYENFQAVNPAVSVLQKEIIEPVSYVETPVQPIQTTQAPIVVQESKEYLPPLTESVSFEDGHFEIQKINKVKIPTQKVLLQPEYYTTVKPEIQANILQTYQQFEVVDNVTTGYDYSPPVTYRFNPKYDINSKIEIAPPPDEYLLSVSEKSTTRQPEYTTKYSSRIRGRVRVRPVTSTSTESSVEYNSRTYLPPTENYPSNAYLPPARRRPSSKKSKTTVVTIGEVDKQEVDEENIEVLLDKYSGKFGEILDEDKEKFITKVIKGDAKGSIKVGKEPEASTVGYEVTSSRSRQRGRGRKYGSSTSSTTTTTESYQEEEDTTTELAEEGEKADISLTSLDLKNLKLKKDKKTVIVVSQVSDANPILIGKLASQCSCQSNELELRKKGRRPSSGDDGSDSYQSARGRRPSNGDDGSDGYESARGRRPSSSDDGSDGYESPRGRSSQARDRSRRPDYNDNIAIEAITPDDKPNQESSEPTILIGGGRGRSRRPGDRRKIETTTASYPIDLSSVFVPESDLSSSLPTETPRRRIPITTEAIFLPEKPSGRRIPSRSRVRNQDYSDGSSNDVSAPLFSPIPADEIASTVDYATVKQKTDISDPSKVAAGAAFDRYGPGGWRGADETLQGSVDCKRPGLFRHPKYCNKFYACNYDPWKKRYTLHVFNCPIHLAYDSNLGACNWPSKGPACSDDNLLV